MNLHQCQEKRLYRHHLHIARRSCSESSPIRRTSCRIIHVRSSRGPSCARVSGSVRGSGGRARRLLFGVCEGSALEHLSVERVAFRVADQHARAHHDDCCEYHYG